MEAHSHSEPEETTDGGFACGMLHVTVLSLLPHSNTAESQAIALVMQARLHGPAPHFTLRLPHAAPEQRTMHSCSGGHSTTASRHESVPEHSTRQGRSSGQVMICEVQAGDPPPPHSMRHCPETSHCTQVSSSQPPGSGGASPHASTGAVVLLEPSVTRPVDVPSAVVPLVLATVVDDEPVVVAGGPELDEDSLDVVIGSASGPCPNSLGEQPDNRHTTAIESPRTPRA